MRPWGQIEHGEKEHICSVPLEVEVGKMLGLCVKLHVCFYNFLKALHMSPLQNLFGVNLTHHQKGRNALSICYWIKDCFKLSKYIISNYPSFEISKKVALKPKITGHVKDAQINSSVHAIANLPSSALPLVPIEHSPAPSLFIQSPCCCQHVWQPLPIVTVVFVKGDICLHQIRLGSVKSFTKAMK